MRDETPLVVYDNDGPVFERLCPKCARFLKFPQRIEYRTRFDDTVTFPKLECSKCGPVDPVHIGWEGDFL